jgi:hypothetical protein
MLPIASATRSAKLTVDAKTVTKKVAFHGDLVTDAKFGVSDETRETETPKTVIRCSDLQPGQRLRGKIVDLQTGEERAASATEKRMYLMPWGEALIGIDPGTRRRLDYSVALAWEYDHWFMRSIRTSVDAETLIGSLGRHPLAPPIDYGRLTRFQDECGAKVMHSPLKALSFESFPALEQCSRAHYVRIKRDTCNVMGHGQKLHCAICRRTIIKDAMQCCKQCKFHMPVCSKDLSPACFATFWKNTHKAVCMRHRLVKSHSVAQD